MPVGLVSAAVPVISITLLVLLAPQREAKSCDCRRSNYSGGMLLINYLVRRKVKDLFLHLRMLPDISVGIARYELLLTAMMNLLNSLCNSIICLIIKEY